MREGRALRGERLVDMQRDARISLAAVPVTPVPLHLAQGGGNLVRGGLDFLEAHDIRPFALDPFLNLRLPGPDAVDVPGGDLQRSERDHLVIWLSIIRAIDLHHAYRSRTDG